MIYESEGILHEKNWWETLILESPRSDEVPCPNSECIHAQKGQRNDSIDVVCMNDDALLIGINIEKSKKRMINMGFFIISLLVALAVGYLRWFWPIYFFGGAISITFFALFFRRHRTTLRYYLILTLAAYLGLVFWRLYMPGQWNLFQVSGIILLALLLLELFFFTIHALVTRNDAGRAWLGENQKETPEQGIVAWLAVLLAFAIMSLILSVAAAFVPQVQTRDLLISAFLQFALIIVILAEISAFGLSSLWSLRGEPFEIKDLWEYKPILKPIEFDRVERRKIDQKNPWLKRLSDSIDRFRVVSVNTMIEAVEGGYNNFVVRFINNFARSLIRLANLARRTLIVIARHMARTIKRFWNINKWALRWTWRIVRSYTRVFVAPPLLFWFGAVELYILSINVLSYVHGGSFLLPLVITVNGLLVFLLMTLAASFLLAQRRTKKEGSVMDYNIFTLVEKVLAAVPFFGTWGYILFLILAWGLGIYGVLTEGPYRIGWVTITATIILAAVIFVTQRQSSRIESSK
jgi:hypothetical protein